MGLDTGIIIEVKQDIFKSNKHLRKAFKGIKPYTYSWIEELLGHPDDEYHFEIQYWRNYGGIAIELNELVPDELKRNQIEYYENGWYHNTQINLDILETLTNKLEELFDPKTVEEWWQDTNTWCDWSWKEVKRYQLYHLRKMKKLVKRLKKLDKKDINLLTITYYNR